MHVKRVTIAENVTERRQLNGPQRVLLKEIQVWRNVQTYVSCRKCVSTLLSVTNDAHYFKNKWVVRRIKVAPREIPVLNKLVC